MFKSSISELIKINKAIFEDVNNKDMDVDRKDDVEYSILNYKKILEDMTEYVKGYFEYKEKGEEQYASKLIASTHKFYDEMFENIKYRTTISLYDMKRINQEFVSGTKQLQDMMEQKDDVGLLSEENALLKMTDNQYRKLMKVYKDDMQLYIWLISKGNRFLNKTISDDLRRAYNDKSTPVMHQLKGKK